MTIQQKYICFFNSHKEWGGGEKWHSDTILYLQDKKYSVFFCGQKRSAIVKKLTYKVPIFTIHISNLSFLNPYTYLHLIRLFKKYRTHTVILCLPIDVKVAGVAAKIAGVQNIIYRRGSAIPVKNSWYNRFLFSKIITHVIANSHATAHTILAKNPKLFPKQNIHVLYNGIEIPPLQQKTPHSPFIILAAGRLEAQKNFEFLIPLAQELRTRNCTFVIQIAGEGTLHEELMRAVDNADLTEHIQFLGFVADMNAVYTKADMFILPSLWEGFGFVLAEAMAHELPIVAFDVSSNPELVHDGEHGFLVPLHDVHACADAVCTLRNNPELRTTMGKNARARVQQEFSVAVAHKKFELFLEKNLKVQEDN